PRMPSISSCALAASASGNTRNLAIVTRSSAIDRPLNEPSDVTLPLHVPRRIDDHVQLDQRRAISREARADGVAEVIQALHLHPARAERVRPRPEARVCASGL